MIATAEGYLPNDASLKQATQDATQTVAVHSSPAGATVQIQDYLFPDDSWVSLGVTPLETRAGAARLFAMEGGKAGNRRTRRRAANN